MAEAVDFALFMKKVDRKLKKVCGLCSADLADFRYADCFEAEMSVKETVREALAFNNFEMEETEDADSEGV
jgi:hypothetical protein